MRSTIELRHVDLGDKRLNKRFLKLVNDLGAAPEASIPEASGDWPAAKAAYRFFDNPTVRPKDLRDAVCRHAMEHLPPDGPILAVQDTTGLDFTDHPATTGLGYMAHPKRLGIFLHSVLAVSSDGVPCGILDQRTWTRDPAERGKRSARRGKATAQKESQRWIDALVATEAALPPEREVVTIADREADIYDLFARPRRPHSHLLIRVKPRRGVRHPERLLGPAVRSTEPLGTMVVELKRGDDRPPRRAVLTIRCLELKVTAPVNRRPRADLPDVTLTAILVEEEAPPEGQAAVRWWLVTTLPVRTRADVERVVRWYAMRWLVERYHFVLKSGCKVERLQLETAARLERALAVYSAVAWRLLWLTYQARRHPEESCGRVLSEEERQVLGWATKEAGRVRDVPANLREAVRAIAKLGGFLGRKGDGEPGVKTLWRGLRRLHDMVIGSDLARINILGEPVGKD